MSNWKRAKIFNRLPGYEIGHSQICADTEIALGSFELGDESFINKHCFFNDGGWKSKVTIGNHVYIGANTHFHALRIQLEIHFNGLESRM